MILIVVSLRIFKMFEQLIADRNRKFEVQNDYNVEYDVYGCRKNCLDLERLVIIQFVMNYDQTTAYGDSFRVNRQIALVRLQEDE